MKILCPFQLLAFVHSYFVPVGRPVCFQFAMAVLIQWFMLGFPSPKNDSCHPADWHPGWGGRFILNSIYIKVCGLALNGTIVCWECGSSMVQKWRVILIALFCSENGHDVPFQAEEYAFNWCKEFSSWRVPERVAIDNYTFLEAMQQTMSLDVSTSKLPSLKLTTCVPLKNDGWLEHWEMILFSLETDREWKQKKEIHLPTIDL